MAAPNPSLVVSNPAPLNPHVEWPYFVDEFPADYFFGPLGGFAPPEEPRLQPLPKNPQRLETR